MIEKLEIPGKPFSTSIDIELGSSIVFVGANGAGKTRLAVFFEDELGADAHRISAHRALGLNPHVSKISGKIALNKLRYGWENEKATVNNRDINRWGNSDPATILLNDFDHVLQALFAEQAVTSLQTHKNFRAGGLTKEMVSATKFETLCDIWQRLLPHRELQITGDDIKAAVTGTSSFYSGSNLSDGERSVFYLIAQALVAAESSLLIIDEPELHLHPSITSSLWDEIEAARTDCVFLYITHDLNFASSRPSKKYFIKKYSHPNEWEIEEVPQETGFNESLTTLILGSRRPILFIEGTENSLDLAIYRACYPQWTVIPRGSCEQVLHAVVTMQSNSKFTRVICAGIVDSDDYTEEEIDYFNTLGVYPLPVSEVENLILLPQVSKEIAKIDGFEGTSLEEKTSSLNDLILASLASQEAIEEVVVRYCRRRIDRMLKKFDLSTSKNITALSESFHKKITEIDINNLANIARKKINDAINQKDIKNLLTIYDNKGLVALAAQQLRQTKKSAFEAWLTRILRNEEKAHDLISQLREILPQPKIAP